MKLIILEDGKCFEDSNLEQQLSTGVGGKCGSQGYIGSIETDLVVRAREMPLALSG